MAREKFATQVDADVLKELRALAQRDGRQIQAVVNEAISEYIESRRKERARSHVMATYEDSHKRYATVYQRLA